MATTDSTSTSGTRRLRILQVVQSLDDGGVEQLQVTMARVHDSTRVDLRVCSVCPIGDGRIARGIRAAGIPIVSLGGVKLRNPSDWLRLAALVRAHGVDVLHSHLSTPNVLAVAAGALTRRPVVSTLHNMYGVEEQGRANRFVEMRALRRGTRVVVAVAPEVASDAEQALRLPSHKLVVIPNGIDVSAFTSPDKDSVKTCRDFLLRGRDGPLIVSVGALAARKGHDVLVKATPHLLEHFPEARVAIVGVEADNAATVRDSIHSLGLRSDIDCVGVRADMPEVLAAADLFVLPSRVEGMPLALLEAMAAGTPVVATEVGGVPSAIRDGITGRLVPPADDAELARAMTGLLAAPARSRELAARARTHVEAYHRAEDWAEKLLTVYADIAHAEGVRA